MSVPNTFANGPGNVPDALLVNANFAYLLATPLMSGGPVIGPQASNSTMIGTGYRFSTDSAGSRYAGIVSYRGSDAAHIDLRFMTMKGDSEGVFQSGMINTDHQWALGGAHTPIKMVDIRGATNGLLLLCPSDDVSTTTDIFQITTSGLANVFAIHKDGCVRTSDGGASSPSYGWLTGGADGWYRATTNVVALTLAGTKRLDFNGTAITWYSSTHAYFYIDRGATTNEGLVIFSTAGATKCAVGMDNDSTDNLNFFTNGDLGTPKLTLNSSGDLYSTALTDYSGTSTIVGWASFSTKILRYKKIGKTVFVWFDLRGTSNSTSTTFTLPVATSASIGLIVSPCGSLDSGTSPVAPGSVSLAAGSSTVTIYKDNAGTAWTASGVKNIYGYFVYES